MATVRPWRKEKKNKADLDVQHAKHLYGQLRGLVSKILCIHEEECLLCTSAEGNVHHIVAGQETGSCSCDVVNMFHQHYSVHMNFK